MPDKQQEIDFYRSKGETKKTAVMLTEFRNFINKAGANMILSREKILNAVDVKTEEVSCPEWGGSVIVRGMTAGERDKWEASLFSTKQHGKNFEIIANKDNLRAKFVAASAVDEKGNLLFTVGDIDALTRKSAAPMDRLFAVAQRLSGMSNEDVEELEKNLKSDRTDTSPTV